MPYRYLEHEADIGLEASGASAAEALQAGVQGLLDLMARTATVRPAVETPVEAEGDDLGALYVALLNAVIAERDIAGHLFHDFRLDALERTGDGWRARGTLTGEPIDPARHEIGTEVKAATYAGLRVEERPDGVTLRCVLDL
ncbi:MAG: archease [Sphaerobacter sp.]|nr:archease [Sphaerobacter sp.]